MKTQWTSQVCFCALVAVGLALVGAGAPAQADSRPVRALNGWSGKLGPGIGSVKTPFGVLEVGTPGIGSSDDTLYFHASDGQAVQQATINHMGPGPWSSKSPFQGRNGSGLSW